MSENKKYFYMRLKENFYDSDAMIALESMPDGYKMSNLLMKMYCRSLKGEGRLAISERIPYSPEMLATATRIDFDTVRIALDIFQELGLIEVLDSGTIFMLDIQNYIGQSSTEADRQREYQKRIAEERKQSC
jgi:predicted phage replisome organizer